MWSFRALSASLACSAVALPSSSNYGVVETVNPPRNWNNVGTPDANHIIELRVGLYQSKFDELEKHLYEVSDPFHERYGSHLSKEEVEALVAPHSDSLDALNEWLASHGFGEDTISRSPANDWAVIHMPVSTAEKMLDTKYYIWEHENTRESVVRTTSYSLPLYLHDHIDVIQPTTMFATFKGMKTEYIFPDEEEEAKLNMNTFSAGSTIKAASGVEVDPSCNTTVTLDCLKQLYNLVGYEPQAAENNSIATTGYLEQFANFADYQQFLEDQLPEAVGSTFDVISVKGGLNDQNLTLSGAEAALDVQFAFGISYPTPGTYYTTAGRPPYKPDLLVTENTNEPYADWLDYVLSHPNPPYVISTSYGEPEETVPSNYAKRVCDGFAQLGARGVSLTFSSGDGGVGDGEPDPDAHLCYTNDGRNITRFMPTFPATCPFVTAVGGTEYVPEIAVYFSGGGFSDIYPTPSYQLEAVSEYLKNLPEGIYKDLYNPQGRGFPDVAALGRRFRIFLEGVPRSIGGTSASSPTFAGIVALLNDARLAQNLPPLGFLNPLLYSSDIAETFNDITVGNNPGCGTEGFNATKGWDPVTGLGTPNFYKLLDLVSSE